MYSREGTYLCPKLSLSLDTVGSWSKMVFRKERMIYLTLILAVVHGWNQSHSTDHAHSKVSSMAATTYSFTGGIQMITVPAGMSFVLATLYGASGGSWYSAPGGSGAVISARIPVVPGQVLYLVVGGVGDSSYGGYNGGGKAYCCYGTGGGGATDLRVSPYGTSNRVLVAGGGGGASGACTPTAGGNAGFPNGFQAPPTCDGTYYGGQGGTQTSGGWQGSYYCYYYNAGSIAQGGESCYYSNGGTSYGGGGGGGYYGGGGSGAAGGGGGSSYSLHSIVASTGSNVGNGWATLDFYSNRPTPTPTQLPTSVAPTLPPDFERLELFAVLGDSSCAETLHYGPQRVSPTGSADGAHPSFLSTSTKSRDVPHRYWQQVVTYNSGQELFRIYWTFDVERTLAGHFAAAVSEGVAVTYTVLMPSSQRYAFTGTWRFSSNSEIIGGTFDTTSTTCCFSAANGAWGAGSGVIDAGGDPYGFVSASFWGIGNWQAGDSDCSNVYMNGVKNNAQAYGMKTFMYYTGAQPPTIAPSAAPTAPPSTHTPTKRPTVAPTTAPTCVPSGAPTRTPTREPTPRPSRVPTFEPTEIPTRIPTPMPTRKPTFEPTEIPTRAPTEKPTPTPRPSSSPTCRPTVTPTTAPTIGDVELFAVLGGSACAGALYYGPSAITVFGSVDGQHPSFLSTGTLGRHVPHKQWLQVVTSNGVTELFRIYWTFSMERTLSGHISTAASSGVAVTYLVETPSGERFTYAGSWWFSSTSRITPSMFEVGTVACCLSASDGVWGAGSGGIDAGGNSFTVAPSFWGIGNWNGADFSECQKVFMNGAVYNYGGNIKTFMYYRGVQPPTNAPSSAPSSTPLPMSLPTPSPTEKPSERQVPSPVSIPVEQTLEIQVTQEIYGIDFDAYGEGFTSVIKGSIADCIEGATLDSIFDFYVTAGLSDTGSRRLRGRKAVEDVTDGVVETASLPRQRTVAEGALAMASDADAIGAQAIPQRSTIRLRSHALFHTAVSSFVVAHYSIVLTSSSSCEDIQATIASSLQSGQFEAALHTRAADSGVPELAQASAGTIRTTAADCPFGGRSGSSSNLSPGAVAGIVIVLAVLVTVGGACCCRYRDCCLNDGARGGRRTVPQAEPARQAVRVPAHSNIELPRHPSRSEAYAPSAPPLEAEQDVNVYNCLVCGDNFQVADGYLCTGRVGTRCNAFVCWDCMRRSYVEASKHGASRGILSEEGDLVCFKQDCRCAVTLRRLTVANAPIDVSEAQQNLKVRVAEVKAAEEARRVEIARVAAEEARINLLQDSDARSVAALKARITADTLVLKCPGCKNGFESFTDCFAVTCHCGCKFCAWCLTACKSDAHAHVRNCRENPVHNVYGPMNVWRAHHGRKRGEMCRRLITAANLSERATRMLMTELAQPLRELNIAIADAFPEYLDIDDFDF